MGQSEQHVVRRVGWFTGPAKFGLLAVAAISCPNASEHSYAPVAVTSPPPAPSPRPSTRPPTTADLLGAMAALVGHVEEPTRLTEWARKIDDGQAPMASYIDEVLGTERFANEIMPTLLFGAFVNVRNYYALPSSFVLRRADEPGAPLYLRAPCDASEAVTVRPWWDLSSEVTVCPDAYRPDKWTVSASEQSYQTAMKLACDSQVGSPELETKSLCGCGPNLIRCLRDDAQYDEFTRSLMDEVVRTTAYVVTHDLPMETLFTGNSTFRDRNAELYYRRQKIGALEIADAAREIVALGTWSPDSDPSDSPDQWPEDGKWAAREEVRPGQHAGVLTAPQILHWLPDRRQRQRGYYEIMWCNLRNSFGATTPKVLELNASGNNFFAHDSWKQLAHTDLCTNCHARLDYGSQFFLGYPDSRASTHYNPSSEATGSGPLYGQDIRDPRGTAPLTPVGFAKLAVAQPDFKSCMTSHFASYVLGDRATNDDIRAIETAIEQTNSFRSAMKVALERYAESWRQERSAAAPGVPSIDAARRGPEGGMLVSPALRVALDAHCVECHDEAPYTDIVDSADLAFDFRGSELPRPLLVSMTEQLGFGMMPKDQLIDPVVREDLVGLLVDTLWTEPAARLEARSYYLGRARGIPAQQIDNAIHSIASVAGSPSEIAWGALERGIWPDQSTITPGFLALTGLEALRACAIATKTKKTQTTLEQCLLSATSMKILSTWPVDTRPP